MDPNKITRDEAERFGTNVTSIKRALAIGITEDSLTDFFEFRNNIFRHVEGTGGNDYDKPNVEVAAAAFNLADGDEEKLELIDERATEVLKEMLTSEGHYGYSGAPEDAQWFSKWHVSGSAFTEALSRVVEEIAAYDSDWFADKIENPEDPDAPEEIDEHFARETYARNSTHPPTKI